MKTIDFYSENKEFEITMVRRDSDGKPIRRISFKTNYANQLHDFWVRNSVKPKRKKPKPKTSRKELLPSKNEADKILSEMHSSNEEKESL